jgi:hypothetical protein
LPGNHLYLNFFNLQNLINQYMLNQESKKLIVERIKDFEKAGLDTANLINDKHFLSELTMFLMVMETEGINSTDSFPNLYTGIKDYVKMYLMGEV